AQVLTTRFSFLPFSAETLVISASCTYGPFLMLLAISDSQNWLLRCFAALASADDQALRWLVLVARLHAFLVAPLVHDVPSAARTTTVRVIDRVHHLATNLGPLAEPAALARLSGGEEFVLRVANGADGRQALPVDHAGLGG